MKQLKRMVYFPLFWVALMIFGSGCGSIAMMPEATATRFQLSQGPTAVLPTAVPATEIPATNTPVMHQPWTPTPVPTATPIPDDVFALVVNVTAADTFEAVLQGDLLEQVYTVRLLGVTAPAEPWRRVTLTTLNQWLNGKVVRLVQDNTIINNRGELPRYVYAEDTLVNLNLIEQGLAEPAFSAPDTMMKSKFEAAAERAQSKEVGLWGPNPTATVPPLLTATPALTATAALTPTVTITGTAEAP